MTLVKISLYCILKCQNQTIIQNFFYFIGLRNENNTNILEYLNKPVYLGPSISKLSKLVMHEFWYNYVKPKNGENTKLGYLDTESFVVYIKTEDIYVNMA